MKKIFFTIFLIASVTSGFCQVNLSLDEYNGLRTKIDSLQNSLKQGTNDYTNREKVLTKQIDSLKNLSQILKKENSTLIAKKDSLLANVTTLRIKADALTLNSDGNRSVIQDLEAKLNRKEEEFIFLKQQNEESEKLQFEKGKQNVLNAVTNDYITLSFDEMITVSSQKQVNRDLKLVVNNDLKQKLVDLDGYFSAKEVLTQRFDDQNVLLALEKIKKIKGNSALVKELVGNFDNFKLRNDGLKEAIQKIQEIDKVFIANTEKDQKEKEERILSQIAWYFYNYDFNNFEDYPYLSGIIIDIMKIKHRDANTDITQMLDKL